MNRIVTLGAAVAALGLGACNEYDLSADVLPEFDSDPRAPDEVMHTDVIVQVTTPRVDTLYVIDNSCSMSAEQEALTENFPYFIEYFTGSGLDYHVGVVSTDMDDPTHSGKLRAVNGTKYIDTDTPNPVGTFTTMAAMGISGSGTERGLEAAYTGLELLRDTYNAGFYRDEASIHTVVVSDEPDQSRSSVITVDEFIDWYDGLKQAADDRTFSSIVSMATGGDYLRVTNEIGGISWDILDTDWAVVLDRLGVQASGLKREYFLSEQPVEDTIAVEVHEQIDGDWVVFAYDRADLDDDGANLNGGDWTYDEARNSITFLEVIPPALSRVVISYTLLSTTQDGGSEEIVVSTTASR